MINLLEKVDSFLLIEKIEEEGNNKINRSIIDKAAINDFADVFVPETSKGFHNVFVSKNPITDVNATIDNTTRILIPLSDTIIKGFIPTINGSVEIICDNNMGYIHNFDYNIPLLQRISFDKLDIQEDKYENGYFTILYRNLEKDGIGIIVYDQKGSYQNIYSVDDDCTVFISSGLDKSLNTIVGIGF